MRICHIITSLDTGGAQVMLLQLVRTMKEKGHTALVISLSGNGNLDQDFLDLGVNVLTVNLSSRFVNPLKLVKIRKALRSFKPDIIQTWLYHADFIGSFTQALYKRAQLVWGVHHTDPFSNTGVITKTIIKINAFLSDKSPDRIIYCSEDAADKHMKGGYAGNSEVIENGIDTDKFKPSVDARIQIRNELGISINSPLIGLVARFHPIKDHQTFVLAAGHLSRKWPQARFLLCGEKIEPSNTLLWQMVTKAGIQDRVHLLGVRSDIEKVTASLDIACCTSLSESFALSLGEAMACGIPCASTRLSAPVALMGALGRTFEVGDYHALNLILDELLQQSEAQKISYRLEARERIKKYFSVQLMCLKYERLYKILLAQMK